MYPCECLSAGRAVCVPVILQVCLNGLSDCSVWLRIHPLLPPREVKPSSRRRSSPERAITDSELRYHKMEVCNLGR